MSAAQEQAAAVVRMSKFPPIGNRGVGSPFAPAYFGQSMTAYQDSAADSTMVIVQIETPLGLENAYEIASTPGIGKLPRKLSPLCTYAAYSQTRRRYALHRA